MVKLNSKQLRESSPTQEDLKKIKRRPIYIILEDVLDTYNTGAIFRLADAVAAEKIFLCGKTTTPPDHKIKKASVGTWQWVPWKYAPTALDAISKLKVKPACADRSQKLKVVGIEQDERSVAYDKVDYQFPIAFVLGHETDGIQKKTLDACDMIVEIPLFGINTSLNVMVSCAIVLYEAIKKDISS